jgi:hypothetical protein
MIQFRCYSCKALLQIESAAQGQLIQCGSCQKLLQLQAPPKDAKISKERQKIWRTLPPHETVKNVQATQASSQYWNEVVRESEQTQQRAPTSLVKREDPFQDRSTMKGEESPMVVVPASYLDAERRRKVRVGKRMDALQGCLVLFGIFAVIACTSALIFTLNYHPKFNRETLTLHGYSVECLGTVTDKGAGILTDPVAAKNATTGSIYEMGFLETKNASVEGYVEGVRKLGAKGIYEVTRGRLAGVRYQLGKTEAFPPHEAEVFSVDGGLLIISYTTGGDISLFNEQVPAFSPAECRVRDQFEAFFYSLKKKTEE